MYFRTNELGQMYFGHVHGKRTVDMNKRTSINGHCAFALELCTTIFIPNQKKK